MDHRLDDLHRPLGQPLRLDHRVDDEYHLRQLLDEVSDREILVGMTPRNFSPASTHDAIVYGADRPGYDAVQVSEWIEFMLARGIRRVVCLLSHERLTKYDDLLAAYRQHFTAVTHTAIDDHGLPSADTLELALTAIAEAERAGERIVLHCAAGMGRTGLIASAWLCRRHGLTVDEAIAEVCEAALRVGANRDPLEAGPEARSVIASARPHGPA